jgi:hypothetical protein
MSLNASRIAMIFAVISLVFAGLANGQQPSAPQNPDQPESKPEARPATNVRAQPAQATPWLRVKELRSGWGVNRAIVFLHEGPLVGTNPETCPVTNYGYVVNEAHGGANLFHTYLLTALMNNREVSLVIHDCFSSVPQVVGVSIK